MNDTDTEGEPKQSTADYGAGGALIGIQGMSAAETCSEVTPSEGRT